jgi:uncharacterized protein YdcH (DUF465 family)
MARREVPITFTALDKTEKAFKNINGRITKLGSVSIGAATSIAKIGTVAATAAAAGLAVLAKQSFDYIDTIGKTASRTGIATETLQAFQLAALESGTTIEQAQKGLEKFARSIGDAQRGLKTQQDIFKDLGVAIDNADGSTRNFEEILKDVAQAISKMGSEADRATVLANLFGRAGIQFTEIFYNGAQGLEDFIQKARDFGIILSEKTIRQTEKFNDTIALIGLQVKNFINNVFAAFVPILQVFATRISETIKSSAQAAGGFESLGKVIAVSVLESISEALKALDGFFNFALKGIYEVKNRLKATGLLPITEEEKRIDELQKKINALVQPQRFTTRDSFSPISQADLDKAQEYQNEIDALKLKIDAPFQRSSFLIDTANALDGIIKDFKEGKLDIDDFYKKILEGGERITDQASPLARMKQQLEDVRGNLETGIAASMKKFEDTLVDGLKNGKLAFKDFANFVVEQLLRIAIQKAIIAPITGGFEDFLSSVFGGKALGGSVKPGTPYLVGESGRELFVPGEKGQIVSNNDLSKMGQAGSAPTVNFNISTVDAAGFDELLASRKGLITAIINNAMNSKGRMGVV